MQAVIVVSSLFMRDRCFQRLDWRDATGERRLPHLLLSADLFLSSFFPDAMMKFGFRGLSSLQPYASFHAGIFQTRKHRQSSHGTTAWESTNLANPPLCPLCCPATARKFVFHDQQPPDIGGSVRTLTHGKPSVVSVAGPRAHL